MERMHVINLPGGDSYFVLGPTTPSGKVFYVDSGTGTDGAGYGSLKAPLATIDYAVGLCTANAGDVIAVMSAHTETLDAAGAITADVAGIRIVGLKSGTQKPTLSVDTEHDTTPVVVISADNCVVEGFRFVGANTGGSSGVFSVSGSYAAIRDCEFIETAATTELCVTDNYGVITIDDSAAAVTEVEISGCTMCGAAGDDESFIAVTDGSNGATLVTVKDCRIVGTFADDVIQLDQGTNVNTQWSILDSVLVNLAATGTVITIDTGAVVFMHNLGVFSADGDAAPIVGYNASYMGNVYSCEGGAYGSPSVIGSATDWSA